MGQTIHRNLGGLAVNLLNREVGVRMETKDKTVTREFLVDRTRLAKMI